MIASTIWRAHAQVAHCAERREKRREEKTIFRLTFPARPSAAADTVSCGLPLSFLSSPSPLSACSLTSPSQKTKPQMRHRRPTQRRQIDSFKRADESRIAAENYLFCTIEPNTASLKCDPRWPHSPRCKTEKVFPRSSNRRHRGTRRGGIQRRRPRQPVPANIAGPTRSLTWCAVSRPERDPRANKVDRSRTSRRSTPSSRCRLPRSRQLARYVNSRAPAATRRRSDSSPCLKRPRSCSTRRGRCACSTCTTRRR